MLLHCRWERKELIVQQMASLSHEVIKLSTIRETAKREVNLLMESVVTSGDRSKVVVIDPSLMDTFRYSGVTLDAFKLEKGVQGIFHLNNNVEVATGARNLVFFLRPTLSLLRVLSSYATTYCQKHPKTSVFIYFVPRKSMMAEHILETEYKLSEKLTHVLYGELDMELVPLDDDVVSMELPDAFRSLYLDGDLSVLHWIAKAIIKLQTARFGPIPHIKGKGVLASKVVSIVQRLQHEIGEELIMEQTPEVEAMYIVDRGVDLVTPLVTQLTYEGLIEELYGIEAGHFDPPFEVTAASDVQVSTDPSIQRDRKIPLNGNDRMFSEIRDSNFATVGTVLHQKSMWVKQSYERRKDVQHLKELKEFMKGLPEMQEFHRLIGVHTNIATQIGKNSQDPEFRRRIAMEQNILQGENEKETLDYMEELINRNEPFVNVLRLLCLYSVVNNGFKGKVLDQLKESLMLSYGVPQVITALHCLEKAGLLTKNEQRSNFPNLRKSCKLWSESLQESHPTDIAYAYSGYAPLLCRVLESMAAPLIAAAPDAEDIAPGDKAELRNNAEVPGSTRVVMLLVIGGITNAEISALRFLESRLANAGEPKHFVVVTTNITSGKKLIESLLPFEA